MNITPLRTLNVGNQKQVSQRTGTTVAASAGGLVWGSFSEATPTFSLYAANLDRGAGYEVLKRAVDVAGATALLLALAPVFVVVATLVRLGSKGPVFFRQKRLGRDGETFWCLKFRTMVADAEEQLRRSAALQNAFQKDFKIKDDPRVTPLGSFLRRTSLDELPQLFNVLQGDMSLIGPRPIVPKELEKYGSFGEKLLTVKPGLGGAWQASGRSDVTYDERVALDMDYIDGRSLRVDLSLLLLTAASVLRRRGAY